MQHTPGGGPAAVQPPVGGPPKTPFDTRGGRPQTAPSGTPELQPGEGTVQIRLGRSSLSLG
ncbi:hypothetical protein ACFWHL_31515 [Streptomyces massasporeus]